MNARSAARRNVLLTGATGFLGGGLARNLARQGYGVIAVVRDEPDSPRLDGLREIATVCSTREAGWLGVFGRHAIDAVVHVATCYGRQGEGADVVSASNLQFPLQLLAAASDHGVGVFINTDTPLPRLVNAYALSKAQFREWGELLKERIAFINVRVENFYGPGEGRSKFVAQTIRNCLDNLPVLDFTPGEQQRDFIYIDDVLSAYLAILEKHLGDRRGGYCYEVGSGAPVSIRAFVKTVHRMCGSDTQLRFGALPYRANELFRAGADVSALEALGWKCRTGLEEGLRRTIEAERRRVGS